MRLSFNLDEIQHQGSKHTCTIWHDPCGGEQHGHAQERVGTSSQALRTRGTRKNALAKHTHTHGDSQQRRAAHPARPALSSRHHAETRHPGTADAAHRHARAGLRERNGPKPTRGARAHRPTTSQHRVGRRRRGSDERRRTLLFARELLDAYSLGRFGAKFN